ncbi:hypothetical protein [Sorangium sp. So ce176]|uniref:hypothetical protein n=1 Tax=Sorangium sp. So ce176 TaxID=3133286 RepID=UPI003F617F45
MKRRLSRRPGSRPSAARNVDRVTEDGRYGIVGESNLEFAAIDCRLGRKTAQLAQRGEPNALLEESLR